MVCTYTHYLPMAVRIHLQDRTREGQFFASLLLAGLMAPYVAAMTREKR